MATCAPVVRGPATSGNATLQRTLVGPQGTPVLQSGDATIKVVGDPTAGTIRITIANAKTAQLECGRYIDSLQLTIGDVISPLWTGVILVAANEARAADVTETPT